MNSIKKYLKKEYIILFIIVLLILLYILFPAQLKYYVFDSLHTSTKYYFDAGVKYVEKGDIQYAIGSFKRALRFEDEKFSINPRDVAQLESLFNLGVINYKYLKDYPKAMFYFNKYLDVFPEDVAKGVINPHKKDIYNVVNFILGQDDTTKNAKAKELKTKGNAEFFNKNYKEALKYYEQANKIDPAYIEVYNNIATVYFEMKNFKKAIEYWKTCLLFTPDDLSLYINIALAYETSLKDYKNAVKYYELYLKKAPPNAPQRKLVQQKIDYINKKFL